MFEKITLPFESSFLKVVGSLFLSATVRLLITLGLKV